MQDNYPEMSLQVRGVEERQASPVNCPNYFGCMFLILLNKKFVNVLTEKFAAKSHGKQSERRLQVDLQGVQERQERPALLAEERFGYVKVLRPKSNATLLESVMIIILLPYLVHPPYFSTKTILHVSSI